jgi:hypothetical protein
MQPRLAVEALCFPPARPPRPTSTPTQERKRLVLFHITQVHTPETCPRDEGGSNTLFDANVPGVKLIGRYGANAQHVLFYIVEADDAMAIQRFLWPGFKRCTATVTPVIEVPVQK